VIKAYRKSVPLKESKTQFHRFSEQYATTELFVVPSISPIIGLEGSIMHRPPERDTKKVTIAKRP
jgi:hypothetical protein